MIGPMAIYIGIYRNDSFALFQSMKWTQTCKGIVYFAGDNISNNSLFNNIADQSELLYIIYYKSTVNISISKA